ncbi:hypothetical protein COV94_04280 [Candidatus Woesearchaeota archaeon CG11_big_fil_rev_8_21_14_0_20_57_5]|nr:MAG: hypothetical protein COV94_04280 [Candidatus Woesearchaeota archaeon CG11_big_fil_rev_8_21_14_0_20_57_5]
MVDKNAEMGMGTLIIFIAMILVAAIAASVLISTTGALRGKALTTGKATTQEVGTVISTVQLYGEDGSNQTVDHLYLSVKLGAGSDAIKFSDTLIRMQLSNTTADYLYSASGSCTDTSTLAAGGDFGVKYQITGTNNKSGYLVRGDVIQVCMIAPREIREGEKIRVSITPMAGSPTILEVSVPDQVTDKRVSLFP